MVLPGLPAAQECAGEPSGAIIRARLRIPECSLNTLESPTRAISVSIAMRLILENLTIRDNPSEIIFLQVAPEFAVDGARQTTGFGIQSKAGDTLIIATDLPDGIKLRVVLKGLFDTRWRARRTWRGRIIGITERRRRCIAATPLGY